MAKGGGGYNTIILLKLPEKRDSVIDMQQVGQIDDPSSVAFYEVSKN